MFGWNRSTTTRGKNILLIIDPQIDFHTGSLAVPHAIEDATKIVELINSGKFDEIHVSLDTHTNNHIGHSGFYKSGYVPFGNYYNGEPVKDEEGNDLGPKKDDKGKVIPKTVAKKKIVETDVVLPDNYLENYNEIHKTARNTDYMMWPIHCIEGSDGHKIYKPIHEALEEAEKKEKNNGTVTVRYHIKGQNELTEMYSIFSATVDPTKCRGPEKRYNPSPSERYKEEYYNREEGVSSYDEACKHVNLDTSINTGLINNLCGEQGENTVYVCGQAKSHCVADSIIDLLKVGKGKVVLIEDASSPVLTPDEGEKFKQGQKVDSFLLGIAEDNISKAKRKSKISFKKKYTITVIQELGGKPSQELQDDAVRRRSSSFMRHVTFRGGRKTRKNKRTKRTKAKRANKKKRKNTQRR